MPFFVDRDGGGLYYFYYFSTLILVVYPYTGGMLWKGLFKSTAKIVAKGVDEQKRSVKVSKPKGDISHALQDDGTVNKVLQIVADQSGVDVDQISLNLNLQNDLGMDDLDRIETIMAVEEEFDVKFPFEDDEQLTVLDLVTHIEKAKK